MTLMYSSCERASDVTKKSEEFILLTDVMLPKMFLYNPFSYRYYPFSNKFSMSHLSYL